MPQRAAFEKFPSQMREVTRWKADEDRNLNFNVSPNRIRPGTASSSGRLRVPKTGPQKLMYVKLGVAHTTYYIYSIDDLFACIYEATSFIYTSEEVVVYVCDRSRRSSPMKPPIFPCQELLSLLMHMKVHRVSALRRQRPPLTIDSNLHKMMFPHPDKKHELFCNDNLTVHLTAFCESHIVLFSAIKASPRFTLNRSARKSRL